MVSTLRSAAAVLLLVAVAVGQARAAPAAPPGTTKMRPARGRLLVASRDLRDPSFARSVVLLLEYGADGSMGVVVNRPTRRSLDELRPAVDTERTDTIYLGGPVLPFSLLVVMQGKETPPDGMRLFTGAHVLTSRRAVAHALASKLAPHRLRFYAGHAGWGPGQLDGEILRGDWHVMAAAIDIVFSAAGADVWERLIVRVEGLWTLRVPDRGAPEILARRVAPPARLTAGTAGPGRSGAAPATPDRA